MSIETLEYQGKKYTVCVQENVNSCGQSCVVTANYLLTGHSRSENELVQESKDLYVSASIEITTSLLGSVRQKTDDRTMPHELEKILHQCGYPNVVRGIEKNPPQLARRMRQDINAQCCYIIMMDTHAGRHWVVVAEVLGSSEFLILDPFYANATKYTAPQTCDDSLSYFVKGRFGNTIGHLQPAGHYLAINPPGA